MNLFLFGFGLGLLWMMLVNMIRARKLRKATLAKLASVRIEPRGPYSFHGKEV